MEKNKYIHKKGNKCINNYLFSFFCFSMYIYLYIYLLFFQYYFHHQEGSRTAAHPVVLHMWAHPSALICGRLLKAVWKRLCTRLKGTLNVKCTRALSSAILHTRDWPLAGTNRRRRGQCYSLHCTQPEGFLLFQSLRRHGKQHVPQERYNGKY